MDFEDFHKKKLENGINYRNRKGDRKEQFAFVVKNCFAKNCIRIVRLIVILITLIIYLYQTFSTYS